VLRITRIYKAGLHWRSYFLVFRELRIMNVF